MSIHKTVVSKITVDLIKHDLIQLNLIWATGSIFLLPILSNLLVWTVQRQIDLKSGKVLNQPFTTYMTIILELLNVILVVAMIICTVSLCVYSTYTNQMLIALSILGSLVYGTFITNMMRVAANWLLPPKLSCLTTQKAR